MHLTAIFLALSLFAASPYSPSLDPQAIPGLPIEVSSTALTPTNIVGNAIGDLGHAAGVLVITPKPNRIMVILAAYLRTTFVGDNYNNGGNIGLFSSVNFIALSTTVTAPNSFRSNNVNGTTSRLVPVVSGPDASGIVLIGEGVSLRSASAFNQPGNAGGTGQIIVMYVTLTP